MNKEEEMFLRIINSYSRKIMPPFSLEEHALIKYENFCKELIQENKQLKEKLKCARNYVITHTVGNGVRIMSPKYFLTILDFEGDSNE